MNRKVLGMFAGAGLVLLCAAGILRAQVNRPGDTIQLWEYHTEVVRGPATGIVDTRAEPRRGASSSDSMLNSWGRDGWELVGVARREIRVDDVMQTETLYAFKRPTGSQNR